MAASPPPKISGQALPWLVRTVPRRHRRHETPGANPKGKASARKRLHPGATQKTSVKQVFHRRTRATVPVGARAPSCSNPRVEIAYLFLGLVPGDAVAFLQLARQVFRTSGCGLEIVVRELAPAGLQRAAELLPLALDRVLVHPVLLWRLDPGYPQALQLAFELVYL